MSQYKTKMPTNEKIVWASIILLFIVMAIGMVLKATGNWEGF